MVFQQHEIETAVLDHFTRIFVGQREPVQSSPSPNFTDVSDTVSVTILDIDNILNNLPLDCPEDKFEQEVCSPYTLTELSQTLANLPAEKAAGIDQIPNEMLKHSSQKFKQYLQLFLNQMIKEGRVPETLNHGKCVLIHKV